MPPLLWGGDPECQHQWQQGPPAPTKNATQGSTESIKWPSIVGTGKGKAGQFCRLCGCWRGSLGLEPTPELYIEHLVGIFRQVKRVLRNDGTVWCNIAGCYAGSSGSGGKTAKQLTNIGSYHNGGPRGLTGYAAKQWVPIPWMLGTALQADGWWLRSPIIWAKGLSFCETYSGSVMPESVRDRPTTSYEYLLLLTKSARYFYDNDAVREKADTAPHLPGRQDTPQYGEDAGNRKRRLGINSDKAWAASGGRNLRSVWAIPEQLYGLRDDLDAEVRARVLSELAQRGLL